ncbi:MAG TPA: hypothetical protein VI685_11720, partial [Candidatus Angelobacter sp.]
GQVIHDQANTPTILNSYVLVVNRCAFSAGQSTRYTARPARINAVVPKPAAASQYQYLECSRPAMIPADPAPGPASVMTMIICRSVEVTGKNREVTDMPAQARSSMVKPAYPAIFPNLNRREGSTINISTV